MKLNSMAALWAGHNQIYYIAKHLTDRPPKSDLWWELYDESGVRLSKKPNSNFDSFWHFLAFFGKLIF